MGKAKVWWLAVVAGVMLTGAMLLAPAVSTARPDKDRERGREREREREGRRDHWRHHKGHWSYWSEPDRRWYYTDGTHWFYRANDDDAWRVYTFDKQFGREGFERGEYKAPAAGIKITLPRHEVYIPR